VACSLTRLANANSAPGGGLSADELKNVKNMPGLDTDSSIPIVHDKYLVLRTKKEALSAHKVCTADEQVCVAQDRVVAILFVKDLKDPSCETFGAIGKFFPKGSLSFFVTAAEEVILTYAEITGGLGPTIVTINPYNPDGSKKPGKPRMTMLPREISVYDNHNVTEWLIGQTLAQVEQWPSTAAAKPTQAVEARKVLFQACNWVKLTIYIAAKTRGVPDEVMDALEERDERQVTAIQYVSNKDDLAKGFKPADIAPTLDKIQHGFVMISLKDPRSGQGARYATTLNKLHQILDNFYIDIRDKPAKKARAKVNGKEIANLGDVMAEREEEEAKIKRAAARKRRAENKERRHNARKDKKDKKAAKRAAYEKKKKKDAPARHSEL